MYIVDDQLDGSITIYQGKIMENKEVNFSGKGILTVITGIIIMGSTIATLSSYLLDLIML